MKLYYSPGACSLAPHIVLREEGIKFDLEKVDLATKKTASGKDFNAINAKGYVPALELDSGEVITEVLAIQQYLAELKPDAMLMPKGGIERFRLIEWLVFISTEIHKGFGPLWAKVNDEAVAAGRKRLEARFDYLNDRIAGKKFLFGDHFTVADAYLFTVLGWSKFHKIDLARWPNVQAYVTGIAERPSVREAMTAEGLIKKAAA